MKPLLIAAAMAALPFAFDADSGLNVGEYVTPFHPQHVTGPNKGTDACPPWTYGRRPQVQVWINNDDSKNVETLVKTLNEAVVANKEQEFKAFFIFLTDDKAGAEANLAKLAEDTKSHDLALAHLSPTDGSVERYKVNIDKEVKNTIFVYRNKKVAAKHVNLVADENGLAELKKSLEIVLNAS